MWSYTIIINTDHEKGIIPACFDVSKLRLLVENLDLLTSGLPVIGDERGEGIAGRVAMAKPLALNSHASTLRTDWVG